MDLPDTTYFTQRAPLILDMGPPPASDIWWPSLETCSNLFTWGPPLPPVLTSGGHWSTHGWQAGGWASNEMPSCQVIHSVEQLFTHNEERLINKLYKLYGPSPLGNEVKIILNSELFLNIWNSYPKTEFLALTDIIFGHFIVGKMG